jgi:hypothetical protein
MKPVWVILFALAVFGLLQVRCNPVRVFWLGAPTCQQRVFGVPYRPGPLEERWWVR